MVEPKALVEHYLNTINKTKIQMKKSGLAKNKGHGWIVFL